MADMDVKAYILTSTRNSSGGPQARLGSLPHAPPQGWGDPLRSPWRTWGANFDHPSLDA
jgi:hypothetical protein